MILILYLCEISLLWPMGSEVTETQWVCKHHVLTSQGSYQRQTHVGPGVNTLSGIQISAIKIKRWRSCSYNCCLALTGTTMDLVLDANNLVPDIVLLLLLSIPAEPLPCLTEWVFLAASTGHYSWAQPASGRRDCCCRKPSLEAAVSISGTGTARHERVPAPALL